MIDSNFSNATFLTAEFDRGVLPFDNPDMDISLGTVMLGTAMGDFVTQFGPLILFAMMNQGRSVVSNAISRWMPSLVVPRLVSLANPTTATELPVISDADGDQIVQFRLEKAAEQGHPLAQYELGNMYYDGDGIRQDFTGAFKWYEKAAEQGYSQAQYELGGMYFNGQGVRQDLKEAFKWYEKSANQGLKEAQFQLGIMFHKGQGVRQDLKEAFKWNEKSANQGLKEAQYSAGFMYYSGDGVRQDFTGAFKWYEKAAEQGYSQAQYELASLVSKWTGGSSRFYRSV